MRNQTTKCSVEVFGFWEGDKKLFHRLDVVLFHAWRGGSPLGAAEMGPARTASLTDAIIALKRPGTSYYWNAVDVAAYLIARRLRAVLRSGTAFGRGFSGPRFTPCLEMQRNSNFLWRIHLLPKGNSEVTCYKVVWNERNALEQLYPVDWSKEVAKQKSR